MKQGKSNLKIGMLGALRVEVGGKTAVFNTDAQRVLLAYLAVHQGIPQRRDTLAGLLSPDRPNKEALTYLRNRLTRLRRVVGNDHAEPPWIDIARKQLTLRTGSDVQVDITHFEQLIATVETHPHRQLAGCPACLARLQEAVGLVRGELLAGLNFASETWEMWLTTQREHFQQRALEAMGWLCEAQQERGEWTAVLNIAQRQLAFEPWSEAAHRAIMQAHFQLGDRNAALAQYEKCEQLLWDELGVEPEPETQYLRQTIFDDTQLVMGGDDIPHNLPLQSGPFFGREDEKAQLIERLVSPHYRLITLVGPGGIGKTRLSLEVGKQVKESFPDGVWFVPLDAVKGRAEQIKIAVGEALGLAQDDKQLTGEQVIAILRDKQMLIIFDNSEPVLEEIDFIAEWLRRAPQIVILATSREPLNFETETIITLNGLPTGTSKASETGLSAAEELFAERARMAQVNFRITAVNLPHIRQICQLVDGSPLGIGLAAAWVRRRSLSQIIDSISQSIDFLSTRQRDVDPRHRSIRAVLETSWQLLMPEDQEILAMLSVFPATFSAQAAKKIARATLFDLDILCDKSLLQLDHESERYGMHQLVRQFSAEKLAANTLKVERRFVNYFYQFAQTHRNTYPQLQPEWLNFAAGIRKAHALALWQQVIDFIQVLDEPWFRQIRFSDMREGLLLALDAATALQAQAVLAKTLLRLGEIGVEQNEYVSAEIHLANALEQFMHLEDGLGIANTKYLLGRIRVEQSRDEEAFALCTDARRLFAEEGNMLGMARALNLLAHWQIKNHRDFQTASDYLEQSITLQRKRPLSSVYIETLRYLARVKAMMEAYVEAEDYLVEAVQVSQQQGDLGEYAAVLYERLLLCKVRNETDAALTFGYESLDGFRTLGSLRWEALVKTQLGLMHQRQQNHNHALAHLQEGLQLFEELGDMYEQAYSHYYLSQLYTEMGAEKLAAAAKQRAKTLNLRLKDPQLTARLT